MLSRHGPDGEFDEPQPPPQPVSRQGAEADSQHERQEDGRGHRELITDEVPEKTRVKDFVGQAAAAA